MRSYIFKSFACLLFFTLVLLPQARVSADTLFVSPTAGNYNVGQTFSIRVLVSTSGRAVNAISGSVSFPREQMQVTSVSKTGSILSLWVVEPTFSNAVGSVNFEGVVPNPGYIGSSGTVLTINFRVVAPGDATVRVSSGSILANDGLGTNILRTMGTSSFTFSSAPAQTTPTTPNPTTPLPVVEEAPDVVEVPIYNEEPLKVVVEESFYDKLIDLLSTLSGSLVGLFLVVVGLVTLLMYGRSRFVHLRSRVRRETYDVEKVLHESFDTIKEDITACVGLLERAKARRRLTEEERAVVSLLKQHLRETERLVTKELQDIRHHAER